MQKLRVYMGSLQGVQSLKISILTQHPELPIEGHIPFQDLLTQFFDDLGERTSPKSLQVLQKCFSSSAFRVLHHMVRNILGMNRPQYSMQIEALLLAQDQAVLRRRDPLDLSGPPTQLIPSTPLTEEEGKVFNLINLRAKQSHQPSTDFERILDAQALGLSQTVKILRSKYQLSPEVQQFFQNYLRRVVPGYQVGDRNLPTVQSLISDPQISENLARVDGITLLHGAVQAGLIEGLKALIAAGANIDTPNNYGKTPAHWATRFGNIEALRLLINSGANIDAPDNKGKTPAHRAAQHGQIEALRLLINSGANIDATDHYGWTPAHWAARFGQTETLRLLITSGANFDAPDHGIDTPAHWAALFAQTEALRLLITSGANIDAPDEYGKTPAHRAARFGYTETLRLLITSGANVDAPDHEGQTPAHWAAWFGHTETLRLLITSGANIDATDEYGKTPAHRATLYGQIEALRLLITSGANIDATDNLGGTPAHLAARFGQIEVIRTLHELGGNLNKLDRSLHTPWSLANNKVQSLLEELETIPSSGNAAQMTHHVFGIIIVCMSLALFLYENRESN